MQARSSVGLAGNRAEGRSGRAPPRAQVPADDAARRGAGMAAFHCYNSAALASLDSYLRLDAAHGMESVAVVWGGAARPARALKC
jgi:hypothetical protein